MSEELKPRTKQFALRVIRLVEALPSGPVSQVISRQLIKSSTAVGANYRSACRARSRADFISKLGHVEQEADESGYWMELVVEAGLLPKERLAELLREADELVAIAVSSIKTARNS